MSEEAKAIVDIEQDLALRELSTDGVFIVMPAYNEEQVIGEVVSNLRQYFKNIVVVDDGSSDDTVLAAQRSGAAVLRHVVNRGQGAALQTGISFSLLKGAEIIVTYDADGQHELADVFHLIEAVAKKEVDVALGSRFLKDNASLPPSRRALLRVAVLFSRLTSGLKVSDAHNGMRAFSRKAAEKIEITLDRMAHASEILDEIRIHHLSYREIPVTIHYTEYSRAKGQRATAAISIALDYLLGKYIK
ncbi:MAG: glycosyltransferase family 2 protein [Myxococcales bacterium]|nr:MAG: glycosyltransferase family 2 protein [Myxococcales bacterium]